MEIEYESINNEPVLGFEKTSKQHSEIIIFEYYGTLHRDIVTVFEYFYSFIEYFSEF